MLVLTALAAVAAPSSAALPGPKDWPQLFGPERNGVVDAAEWSTSGAAKPLWARNVGLGYSCPSIVGERLVTMGYDGDAGKDRVLCLRAGSGEELWSHAYDATDDPRFHSGGTLTTPAIADGIVYTLNRHGRAFALELESGEVLWERDYREELGLGETFHGFCASPVVEGDRVVYLFGGSAAAVERAGGDVLWHSDHFGDGAYTNPTVFEHRGKTLIAAMLGQTLFFLDLEDGAPVYEFPWPLKGMAVHCAQPLVIDDRVLVSTAYGKGAAMLRLGDSVEPEVLWTSRRLRNKVTGLYHWDGHVFGFDESMLKCFDLEGNEKWRVRGLGMGTLSIAGGRLLVLSSSGEFIVAEANPNEYRELSRTEALDGGSYWTMPVLSDGRIYVRNSLGDMACLDHRAASADAGSVALAAGPADALAREALEAETPRTLRHFFDVETGRLVGREGDDVSTIVFEGELVVGDAKVPETIRLFRSGSGQEEALYFARGGWVELDASVFERPASLARLTRSPEGNAAENKRLSAKYAKEVGSYAVDTDQIPGDVLEVRVEAGELVNVAGGPALRMVPIDGEENAFLVTRVAGRITFEYEDGAVTGLRFAFGTEEFVLPRIE